MSQTPTLIDGTPLPAVHLNGSGRDNLLKPYEIALSSFVAAENAFLDTECHPRDYYIYPEDGAYSQARAKREAMLRYFHELRHYLQAHVDHLTPSES